MHKKIRRMVQTPDSACVADLSLRMKAGAQRTIPSQP